MTFDRKRTHAVMVGDIQVGGDAPVVVQSMTSTDTADVARTVKQVRELAEAGSELVRITVNVPEAAEAVPIIKRQLLSEGCSVPLIGDFHYNGHVLLNRHPECALALDKYRINPGNVGKGKKRDANFETICQIAKANGKPVRIGVNGGSLNQELVMEKMAENTDHDLGMTADEIISECMILSALQSTEMAIDAGLDERDIIISAKLSHPGELLRVYKELSAATNQPLHLGLTEAGMGIKGIVWSASALSRLLAEGIGDTIRVSLTPKPDGDRRNEVEACIEILQALGMRSFKPAVVACPGCGRTTSTTFQELSIRIEDHIKANMPVWRDRYPGVEDLKLAVMGCIVNGPGESKAADIGISLPGTGETPSCPVYIDGERAMTLKGSYDELAAEFIGIVDDYITRRFGTEV